MQLKNCNFKTWLSNHDPEHKDKIYRELYPYLAISKINFDGSKINVVQRFDINLVFYWCVIHEIKLQDNGKYKAKFYLKSSSEHSSKKWKNIIWNDDFQVIFSESYEFVTVFTKREDPSKKMLKHFFKGSFDSIKEKKSLPLSNLFFRTAVVTISEELYKDGVFDAEYFNEFIYKEKSTNKLKIKPNSTFNPVYSIGRQLWVSYAFYEEKAHRIVLYNYNQCEELIVVYCNPNYTRHHRCKHENVRILSLFEFYFLTNNKSQSKMLNQIRFLQNNLKSIQTPTKEELIKEINLPENSAYKISQYELMEALAIMKIIPENSNNLFHYLSSMNLLNAWISRAKKNKNLRLFNDMYYFKTYVSKVVRHLLTVNNYGAKISYENNLTIIEIYEFQFSFHHVPYDENVAELLKPLKKIRWNEKRLQPIAPLVFKYTKYFQEFS